MCTFARILGGSPHCVARDMPLMDSRNIQCCSMYSECWGEPATPEGIGACMEMASQLHGDSALCTQLQRPAYVCCQNSQQIVSPMFSDFPPTISKTASITSKSSMSRCRQRPNLISRYAKCQKAVEHLSWRGMTRRRTPALWLSHERCTVLMTTKAERRQALLAGQLLRSGPDTCAWERQAGQQPGSLGVGVMHHGWNRHNNHHQ